VAQPTLNTEDVSSSGSGQRTTGLILGAVGIVGVGAGTYLWNDGWRNSNMLGPSADRNLLLGQISVIGGGVLLVTGVVLFATAPSREAPKTARLPIAPTLTVGRNATVLGAAGEF
jgi:hypothetical protein